jgi:hypothetical protein
MTRLTKMSIAMVLMAATSLSGLAEDARADAFRRGGRIGLGVGGGTIASGLTAKTYIGGRAALQAVVGFSRWGLSLGGDFIQEFRPFAQTPAGDLFGGLGAGAGLVMYDDTISRATVFGISAVLQLGWHFNRVPLELILDWRPTFYFGDFTGLGGFFAGGGGGAIRWFF